MAICCVSKKNPDRLSAHDCAPWIFSLPCISPFLNGLQILIFSTVSLAKVNKNIRVSPIWQTLCRAPAKWLQAAPGFMPQSIARHPGPASIHKQQADTVT
jgi:hypothetical protein